MQTLPYFVMAGAIAASLVIAISVGGAGWIAPVIVILVVVAYGVFDRRQRPRESRAERLSADPRGDA